MGNVSDTHPASLARFASIIASSLADALPGNTSLRIGTGATVAVSYIRWRQRTLFLHALHKLVPKSTYELLNPEKALSVHAAIHWEEQGTELMSRESQTKRDADGFERMHEAYAALHTHVDAWQSRYDLPDAWIHDAAIMTIMGATLQHSLGKPYSGPLTMTDDRPPFESRDVPITSFDLNLLDDIDENDGAFGAFDPRSESVDDAVKRLLPDLESRLRRHLDRIVTNDRTLNDAMESKSYRKAKAFDWLVRYQVLGVSRNKIAVEDKIDRSHVGQQVNETAQQIGLTIREERGGRPPRTHAHTIRVG